MKDSTPTTKELKAEIKKAEEFMRVYLGNNLNTSALTPFAIQEMMVAFAKSEKMPTSELDQILKLNAIVKEARDASSLGAGDFYAGRKNAYDAVLDDIDDIIRSLKQ